MDSKLRGHVICLDYDPRWKSEFKRVQTYLSSLLQDQIIGVEHVGSTSVAGCAAKPILDIDLVIDSESDFHAVKKTLEQAGYIHRGDQGIEGREVFKRLFEDEFMAYHLYVCTKVSKELLRHLSLKMYLADHPEVVIAYSNLKKELARSYPYSIQDYMDGKDAFIKKMLADLDEQGYLIQNYRNSSVNRVGKD